MGERHDMTPTKAERLRRFLIKAGYVAGGNDFWDDDEIQSWAEALREFR
jgi:hypothetical protein